jgi:hypothetical protein
MRKLAVFDWPWLNFSEYFGLVFLIRFSFIQLAVWVFSVQVQVKLS